MIHTQIAQQLGVQSWQVEAAIKLLDEGSTVPFIARYRKEATGTLDDTQLRTLEERLGYLRELDSRRTSVLKSIAEQGRLTPELEAAIQSADNKTRLEDLYLPYKPKRRTKAQMAIEAGLEPLADKLFGDPQRVPEDEAAAFIKAEAQINTTKDALDGAKQILMERFSQAADLLEELREKAWQSAQWQVSVIAGQEAAGAKFRDYFAFQEAFKSLPSHRTLAILRGRNEGVLLAQIVWSETGHEPFEGRVGSYWQVQNQGRPGDKWLQEVITWTWRIKLASQLETALISRLRETAEAGAIQVFADNLKDLLLSAPAGTKVTLGLDPGLRTGVKAVVVDATGKLIAYHTIFPHVPRNQWQESLILLAKWVKQYDVELVAIGNGTGSRETDRLVKELQSLLAGVPLQRIIVSEAGASVYSASSLAAAEFPDLDVSYRGAVSIARRLQDPLAELVKIDPKAIGVGQYQHDVSQVQLARRLDNVVEDCVNSVGVDLNTASAPLLQHVAGLNKSLAENIVLHRDVHGAFKSRKQLMDVTRLGAKAFEQAAGFLRIRHGEYPLDGTSVHPEAYLVVENMAASLCLEVGDLLGHASLSSLRPAQFVVDSVGEQTITDVLAELQKPGRDPRPEFRMAKLADGIENVKDLVVGSVMEGTVSNVTNFGAFVDLGVHQDGLVHISAMSHSFVKDPRSLVKAGDIIKVKVMEVDVARKRIGLSMRLDDQPGAQQESRGNKKPDERRGSYAKKDARSHQGQPQGGSKAKLQLGSLAAQLQAAGLKR